MDYDTPFLPLENDVCERRTDIYVEWYTLSIHWGRTLLKNEKVPLKSKVVEIKLVARDVSLITTDIWKIRPSSCDAGLCTSEHIALSFYKERRDGFLGI